MTTNSVPTETTGIFARMDGALVRLREDLAETQEQWREERRERADELQVRLRRYPIFRRLEEHGRSVRASVAESRARLLRALGIAPVDDIERIEARLDVALPTHDAELLAGDPLTAGSPVHQ